MKEKKLTFVCPCYNHENYVVDFLNSLLAQNNPNWELLIIDDCSTDASVTKIKSIKDERIHLIQNLYNQGINATFSKGVEEAKTEVISFVASDDLLYQEYVETVLKTFEENPQIVACYTPLNHMNPQGELLNTTTPLPTDKTGSQIFAHMFVNENLLPSPGMAFKKSVLAPYLPLDTGLLQYSDYQMHFFILFQNRIKLLEKPLVQYRVSPKGACARSSAALLREDIETEKLMNAVLNLIKQDKEVFLKYFGNYPLIQENKIDSDETIPFWLGRLALTSRIEAKQKWGLQTIMNFIAKAENLALLHKLYNFSYKDYMGYTTLINSSTFQTPDISGIKKIYKRKIRKLKKIIIILVVLCLIFGGFLCR